MVNIYIDTINLRYARLRYEILALPCTKIDEWFPKCLCTRMNEYSFWLNIHEVIHVAENMASYVKDPTQRKSSVHSPNVVYSFILWRTGTPYSTVEFALKSIRVMPPWSFVMNGYTTLQRWPCLFHENLWEVINHPCPNSIYTINAFSQCYAVINARVWMSNHT